MQYKGAQLIDSHNTSGTVHKGCRYPVEAGNTTGAYPQGWMPQHCQSGTKGLEDPGELLVLQVVLEAQRNLILKAAKNNSSYSSRGGGGGSGGNSSNSSADELNQQDTKTGRHRTTIFF